jgi:hypothetical protein
MVDSFEFYKDYTITNTDMFYVDGMLMSLNFCCDVRIHNEDYMNDDIGFINLN